MPRKVEPFLVSQRRKLKRQRFERAAQERQKNIDTYEAEKARRGTGSYSYSQHQMTGSRSRGLSNMNTRAVRSEEFDLWVEELYTEGYDLSNYSWEDLFDIYLDEAKKMKGKDPCWKGYQMVGTKNKGGREVPNCVPKEEFDAVAEYLFVEGYADTVESAEVMAEKISEEWATEIIEAKVDWHNRDKDNVTHRIRVLRDRNKRLQSDHPEIPSGSYQTDFRRKRHKEARGKKK